MKTIPFVSKVVNVQNSPAFATPLPLGFPVELVRDWNQAPYPYTISVWVQHLSKRSLLGYLPESVATLIASDMEAGNVMASSILQYMRVREDMLPVISVKIEVRTQEAVAVR
jgi:hypothetical protein